MKFEFSVEQTNLLLTALSEQPYKVSAPMIANIQQQAQKQIAEEEAAKKAEDSKVDIATQT